MSCHSHTSTQAGIQPQILLDSSFRGNDASSTHFFNVLKKMHPLIPKDKHVQQAGHTTPGLAGTPVLWSSRFILKGTTAEIFTSGGFQHYRIDSAMLPNAKLLEHLPRETISFLRRALFGKMMQNLGFLLKQFKID